MIKPINRNIVVRLKDRDEVSKGGIVIPERAKEQTRWGVVEAISSKCSLIKEDDIVYITPQQGTLFTNSSIEYVIVDERKVKAKLEE